VKPLTKCQPYLWRELDGTPSIVVIDTESGSYYRASEADAVIRELEAEKVAYLKRRLEVLREDNVALRAERDAARADAERLLGVVHFIATAPSMFDSEMRCQFKRWAQNLASSAIDDCRGAA